MMQATGAPDVIASGYDSPEGPAFDRFGNFFFVNWLSSSILKMTPDGDLIEFLNTGGIPAGLAFHPDGSLWLADEGEHIHGVMRIQPDGSHEIVVNEYEGKPLNGANDLMFDRNGVLYFSDPWGSSRANPVGAFYRFFPDGRLEQIDTGLAFPNGLAVLADGSGVILAETGPNRLLKYAINPDGSMGPRTHWADLPGEAGPDGMALAANGDLLVAHYNGACVEVFDPTGRNTGRIEMPGKCITNCCFGGPGNSTLYVTDVDTQSVYRVPVSGPGLPLWDGRDAG